jgi:AbrB family looped-hinge helix DNA binding protein
MEAISSKVTSKGQVVIPKRLRVKYGIHSATAIRWAEGKIWDTLGHSDSLD